MQLDDATAFEMARGWGSILVLDFPEGMTFGLDMKSWTTGELFKGVKMIPKGTHLVVYGPGDGCLSSFFIEVTERAQVVVVEWDCETESLVVLEEGTCVGYVEAVRRMEFDRNLAPYPLEVLGEWVGLAAGVGREDFERVRPVGGDCVKSAAVDEHGPGSKLYFTEEPVMPKGLSPAEVTKWSFDGSSKLQKMTQKTPNLLSELSLSFLLFLIGQNYNAFAHWKLLTTLILTSETLPSPAFHIAAAKILTAQLSHTPDEFFIVDKGFLPAAFRAYYQIREDDTPPPEVKEASDELVKKAVSLMGSMILEDDEEDLPEVVEGLL